MGVVLYWQSSEESFELLPLGRIRDLFLTQFVFVLLIHDENALAFVPIQHLFDSAAGRKHVHLVVQILLGVNGLSSVGVLDQRLIVHFLHT